jgi:drug/metabolite transporter (DMT)-like permease
LTKQHKAESILLSLTIIWGGTFAIVKGMFNDVSPLLLIGTRFLFVAILMVPFILPKLRQIKFEDIQKGTILGLLLFFGFAAQTIGLQYTTASKSAFLTGTMVIFTPVLQFIMEKRAPKLGNVFGVLIVSAGLYILTSPKGSEFNFGDGLNLVCAILFAIYTVYVDMATQRGEIVNINFVQICTNGIVSLIAALIFEDMFINFTFNFISSFLYLSILATGLTLYLVVKWQRETTPTKAAVIYSIEPVIAAGFAYLLLNEIIGVYGIIGGAIIITGLVISEVSDNIPVLNYSLNLKDNKE